MKCPVCSSVDLQMTERSGVEIDYCPKCRGVWLDRGELDKLIERSSAYTEHRQPEYSDRQHYESGHGDYRHGHKKKKSFLGDMFDFD